MRSHYCGEVDEALIGEEIAVCGWVHRRRDHGGVIFVDLRDREGLLQVVFDPDRPEIFAEAERIRSEYVLAVKGKVRQRPEGTINPNMKTGQVEVLAHELVTLNDAETPPTTGPTSTPRSCETSTTRSLTGPNSLSPRPRIGSANSRKLQTTSARTNSCRVLGACCRCSWEASGRPRALPASSAGSGGAAHRATAPSSGFAVPRTG